MSYFTHVPFDLLSPLFLSCSPSELLFLLREVKDVPTLRNIFNCKQFWTDLWRRDISLIVDPPENVWITYQEIFQHCMGKDEADVVEYTAKCGYDIILYQKLNKYYNLALGHAAGGGHLRIVEKMLKEGADAHQWACYEAVLSGHIKVLEKLVQDERAIINYGYLVNFIDQIYSHQNSHRNTYNIINNLSDMKNLVKIYESKRQ